MTEPKHLMRLGPKPDLQLVRGLGDEVWDQNGRRYLDFVQGWAVNCLGHAPPVLRAALQSQADTLWNPGPGFYNPTAIKLADLLAEHSGLARVTFANSGAEANEAAIKLARKWGREHKHGAHTVLTTRGSFHGRTLAMMAASGKPGFAELFPPAVPGFTHVPYDDVDAIAAAVRADPSTVAIMVEPIQGEAGVVVPSDGYLRELRALCDEESLLLILDEIQTGIGRTGSLFAFSQAGVMPDIVTLGKGLGGGMPISAMLAREEVACFEPGEQGGTFNGNPLCAAVAARVVQHVSEADNLAHVEAMGARLRSGLAAALGDHLKHVRGRGLLLAAVLREANAAVICTRALSAGLLLNAPQPNVLRFMPALNVSADHVDEMLDTIRGL